MKQSTWRDAFRELETRLGEDSCKNLSNAGEFSEKRIDGIRIYIESCPELKEAEDRGFGWIVTGSLGRLEALEASDVDLMLLLPPGVQPTSADVTDLDQLARKLLSDALDVKISQGKNLTSPTSQDEISSPSYIGGDLDTVAFLTKRTLLLTESRSILRPEIRLEFRDAVFDAFFNSAQTKGRHLLSLVNDIARYYRTVCVDYKSRVDSERKPWAVRNIKLRHARKYWFFSSMLAMVCAAARFEHKIEAAEEEVKSLFDRTPTERLLWALDKAGLSNHLNVICWYDKYLGLIGDPGIRGELDKVDHSKRYSSDAFRLLKDNSDSLHMAMIDIIEALPPHWRRHLLGHFLL